MQDRGKCAVAGRGEVLEHHNAHVQLRTAGGTGRRPLMNGTKGAVSSVRRSLAMMTHLARAV